MSTDRKSVPVSLPEGLVGELDELVEEGQVGSRLEALGYGARLVAREARENRLHDLTDESVEECQTPLPLTETRDPNRP